MGGYGSNLPGYNFSSNTFGFPSPNAGQYSYGASNPYGFGFGGYGSGYDGYGTIGNPYTNILGQHQYGQNPYSGQPYGNMSITPVQQGNFRILLTQFIRGASTQLTEVTGQILLAPSGIFMKNLNNNEIYRFTGINENDQNKGLTIWEKIIPMLNRGWYNPFLPPWGMSIY